MRTCHVPRCPGHTSSLQALLHGQRHIIRQLAELRTILNTQGALMSDFHDELDADLADLATKVAADDADLARELADFAAAVSPKLTDAERAQLAALGQKLVDFQSSIDTADQPPAPAPQPAPDQPPTPPAG